MQTRTFIIGRSHEEGLNNTLSDELSNETLQAAGDNAEVRAQILAHRGKFLEAIKGLFQSGTIAANVIVTKIDAEENSITVMASDTSIEAIDQFLRRHFLGWLTEHASENTDQPPVIVTEEKAEVYLESTHLQFDDEMAASGPDISFEPVPGSAEDTGRQSINSADSLLQEFKDAAGAWQDTPGKYAADNIWGDFSPDLSIDFTESTELVPIPGHYRITFGAPDSLELQKKRNEELRSHFEPVNADRRRNIQQQQWEAFQIRLSQLEHHVNTAMRERRKDLGEHPENPAVEIILTSPATFSVIVRAKEYVLDAIVRTYEGTDFIAKVEQFQPNRTEANRPEVQKLLRPSPPTLLDLSDIHELPEEPRGETEVG